MKHVQSHTDPNLVYETIATIFAVAVLIDKIKHDRELIEFAHACCFHNRLLRPTRINARETVMAWFERHAPKIETRLTRSSANDYILSLLTQIGDPALRLTVLSSIFAICVADSELHPEEMKLIELVKSTWRITLPAPERVADVVE